MLGFFPGNTNDNVCVDRIIGEVNASLMGKSIVWTAYFIEMDSHDSGILHWTTINCERAER